jgi:MoxR-like ATPase
MATQNPIEQEGTYPLPEAQLDRFLMYVKIFYPHTNAEHAILKLAKEEEKSNEQPLSKEPLLKESIIFSIREELTQVYLSPALETYIVQLIMATRNPKPYENKLHQWLRFGSSPRGTIALDKCARAHAWLKGRDYVSPEDIYAVAYDVLRHRILLTFEAEADGITTDDFIGELLKRVAIP